MEKLLPWREWENPISQKKKNECSQDVSDLLQATSVGNGNEISGDTHQIIFLYKLFCFVNWIVWNAPWSDSFSPPEKKKWQPPLSCSLRELRWTARNTPGDSGGIFRRKKCGLEEPLKSREWIFVIWHLAILGWFTKGVKPEFSSLPALLGLFEVWWHWI